MHNRGKRYLFRPTVLPGVAAAILTGLFIALGVWQLNRAQEKQAILETYALRNQQSPEELTLPLKDKPWWRYRRVEVTGHFTANRQFLLDNQVNHGRVGYNVLTPLRVTGNRGVLVDRGWIPLGSSRDERPEIPVTSARVRLRAMVFVPYARGFSLGGMDEGETGWPRRVQFIDFERMGARVDLALAGVALRLDPQSPYCYRCEWQLTPFSPARHLGYAVQWFALAVAVLVIFIVVNLKRSEPSHA
ncbi:MAG: SURF1 family protein [Gammaproteobacteria bacterium]